jgi:hypothetical protein
MKNILFQLIFSLFLFKNGIAQPSVIWEKSFGGSKMEWGGSVITTSDGHWLFSAWTASSDGDVPSCAGEFDTWVFKTDTLGNIIWSKTFGGMKQEEGGFLAENPDGSFWLVGETHSFDGIFAANKGMWDIYVLKLSASGDLILNKTFGGTGADDIQSFVPTADGGLVFAASSWSSSGSGDVIFNHGERDCWLVKLDKNAEIEWQKSIGGSKHEGQCQIRNSKNGGFWLTLESQSSNGDFPMLDGTRDTWLLRLDESGNILWKKRLGLPGEMSAHQSVEDADGNMVVMQQFYFGYPDQLEKFAPDGSLISSEEIDFVFPEDSYFKSFCTADDGGFYFFGVDALHTGFLTQTDADFQNIWQKSFPDSGVNIPWQVMPLTTNSLLVVGLASPDTIISFDQNQNLQLWVAKLGGTSAADEATEKLGFQVFPNPVSDNQPLQILLENDFFGTVKFEILSLEGRVLETFFEEKTARQLNIGRILNPSDVSDSAFLMRVSVEKTSATRRVFRFKN